MHSVSEQLLGEIASGKGGHEQRRREAKRRKHSRTATKEDRKRKEGDKGKRGREAG